MAHRKAVLAHLRRRDRRASFRCSWWSARTSFRSTTSRSSTCWCARRKARRSRDHGRWPNASRATSAPLPGVSHTLMTAGGGADESVNNAAIYVKLSDIDQRTLSQQQMMQKARDLLKNYPADCAPAWNSSAPGAEPEQRRRAVLHSRARSRQARRILGRTAGEDEDDPHRWSMPTRRWSAASRKCASKSTASAPPTWACPSRISPGPEHPGRRPDCVHLPIRAKNSTMSRLRAGGVPHQRRRALAPLTVPSTKGARCGSIKWFAFSRAQGLRRSTA